MRATSIPSIKTLTTRFRLTRDDAALIRQLIQAATSGEALETLICDPSSRFPVTRQWARDCYSSPFTSQGWRDTMLMSAVSEVMGGFGEESAWGKGQDPDGTASPRYRYVNMGDTYAPTLILNRSTRTVRVGCWGDLPLA